MKLSVGAVQSDGTFAITLQLIRKDKRGVVRLSPDFADARRSRPQRVANLISALNSQCPDLVRSLRRSAESGGLLVLDIAEPSLYDAPWEAAFSELLGEHKLLSYIRVVQGATPEVPVLPPYTVLWANAADPDKGLSPKPPDELKHYESIISETTTPPSLKDLVSDHQFQVIHFAYPGATKQRGRGALELGGSDDLLSPVALLSLTGKHSPHFLILEGPPGTMNALINFGHNYASRSGAAVLAAESPNTEASRALSREIYMGIAHDEPLDQILWNLYGLPHAGEPPVFITPSGGEQALRLEHPGGTVISRYRDLQAQTEVQLDRLRKVTSTARRQGAKKAYIEKLKTNRQDLRRAQSQLKKENLEFSYDRERAGIEPMGAAVRVASEVSEIIEQAGTITERVVNTWFARGKRPVKQTSDLECQRTYFLRVQIGAPSAKSNNRSPRSLPEKDLERFMTPKGLELRAVLHSRHFKVLEPEKPLLLPPWPLESVAQSFEVEAPAKPRLGELLLLLYYKRNLLQAIRILAGIAKPGADASPKGNYADTEFALEEFSEAAEKLPRRDAQLYVSLGANPTHTMSVRETATKHTFELNNRKLEKALGSSRARLLQLATDLYGGRAGKRSSMTALLSDLQILAQTGSGLFHALGPNEKLRTQLAESLAGHNTLQIAHSTSLDQIFPWAVVYDHPLLVTEPKLCPEAEKVLRNPQATINDWRALECMTQGCRQRGQLSTICPSGFWGFRHTIELPLSLTSGGNGGNTSSGGMKRSIPAGPEVHLCMGAWRDFRKLKNHEAMLEEIPRLRIAGPVYEKTTLERTLLLKDLHILYFYCHGDTNPAAIPPTVLRMGWDSNPSFVYASDMTYFVKWQNVKPLVFINGCHTLDADPDDLVSFNMSLSEGGAAAVIGTEIKVPEVFAASSAETLLAKLVGKEPLGPSLRDFRLGLLQDRNVLGLAYTAYGFSDLTIT